MNYENYHLAPGPSIKTATMPGVKAKAMLEEQDTYESNNRSYPRGLPLVPHIAKGTIIEDVDGNRFMDFFSLCGVLNVGHNNPDVIADIEQQMTRLIHAMDFPTATKLEFMRNINGSLPKGLKDNTKINFCGPTGADSIEAALKLARLSSGRNLVISFQGAYHGMTLGALSVTSNRKNRKEVPMVNQGVHFAPYGYCYRCPFGKSPDSCKIECASYLEDVLENPHSGVDRPAAVLVEPVQGEGGVVVPRAEFHKRIRRLCDEHQVILIHDEVQVGFYRTGKMLASEHFDVTPDLVTMSKGIGGVGMPISILIIMKILDTWQPGTHAGTFRGNQLSMAAGNAALNFVHSRGLPAHVDQMGMLLLEGLRTTKEKSKFIGDVRGIGLIAGVEFVKDLQSKEPFPDFCVKLRQQLFANGVLIEIGGHHSNVIRILPPLITTREMILQFVEIFGRAVKEVEKTY